MVKFLIIGDSHVPKRASEIPKQIQIKLEELAKSELFECTFFTGDEINYPEFMKSLNFITKKEVFRVIGNMDYPSFPIFFNTKAAKIKIMLKPATYGISIVFICFWTIPPRAQTSTPA